MKTTGNSPVSLRGLRTFCVAAQYESFRLAGEALFITSSAVSHQIKSLEQELGQALFKRGSRALSLTDAGESLYREAGPLIEKLDATASRHRANAPRSQLRVSVQPFFASELFAPRLTEFTAMHPELDLHVGTSDESSEKHPPDVDLSIRLFRSPPTNGVQSQLLMPLRLAPAGSPNFARTIKIRDTKIASDFPIIIHETRPRAWTAWARAAGLQFPADNQEIRLDSMIATVRAAEQGLGAALVPVPLADAWFKSKKLVRLFDTDLVSDVSYYLIWKKELEDDSNVKMLRDWILENFAETAEDFSAQG